MILLNYSVVFPLRKRFSEFSSKSVFEDSVKPVFRDGDMEIPISRGQAENPEPEFLETRFCAHD